MAYYLLVKINKNGTEKEVKTFSFSECTKAYRKCSNLKTPHLVYYVVNGVKRRVAFQNFYVENGYLYMKEEVRVWKVC